MAAPPTRMTAAPPTPLRLSTLLSTCVDACGRGCAEIRAVQARRDAGGSLDIELKVANDPRSALTEADMAAQRAIVGSLRAEWPGLRIVGEEDEVGKSNPSSAAAHTPLRRDLCTAIDSDATAPLSDIVVFVDPVDGTREFVEGRLRNCQALVGVAVRGRALAGAIGLPFPLWNLSTEPTVVYGQVGAGAGVVGAPLAPSARDDVTGPCSADAPRPFVATGDSSHPVMGALRRAALAGGGTNLVYGGAGNKILAVATGEVDCALMHTFGGPWDVCAPEAVLVAMGGSLTDLLGRPVAVYSERGRGGNALGFVATRPPGLGSPDDGAPASHSHGELCGALCAEPEVRGWCEAGAARAGLPLPFGSD